MFGSTRARLVDRFAPARQESEHELAVLRRLHGQRCERQCHRERDVIAESARRERATISRMGTIYPHGGFNQASDHEIVGSIVELNIESVVRRTARAAGGR